MSTGILVIGESGTGKSYSLRNLNPKETFIINIVGKPMPFKGARSKYIQEKTEEKDINMFSTRDPGIILKLLQRISDKRPEIKNIIIDDFQYIMSGKFMDKSDEKGWEKFTEIAKDAWNVIQLSLSLRNSLNVIFLTHSDVHPETGKIKCKTIGKMLDEKVCIEGLFTIVFNSLSKDGVYKFLTQNLGNNIAKSPVGMFEDVYIDNDMKQIIDNINKYYDEDVDQ